MTSIGRRCKRSDPYRVARHPLSGAKYTGVAISDVQFENICIEDSSGREVKNILEVNLSLPSFAILFVEERFGEHEKTFSLVLHYVVRRRWRGNRLSRRVVF